MMERIIDFHAHGFPDDLAPRAMKALKEQAPGIKAYLDGTISALLGSMDSCGIEKSVVCCVATKPSQFESIFEWCRQIRSQRLIPFPSVHPADPKYADRIRQIKAEGFKGIKMHPFYQEFYADEERMFQFYERVNQQELLLVMHTGFDIAFPRENRADAQKILRIKQDFPELKLITTHLGAWQQWAEVEKQMIGKEIYMGISFALDYLEPQVARTMLLNHPQGYVLFGTDSPWTSQSQTLSLVKELKLPEKRQRRILCDNALELLDIL